MINALLVTKRALSISSQFHTRVEMVRAVAKWLNYDDVSESSPVFVYDPDALTGCEQHSLRDIVDTARYIV